MTLFVFGEMAVTQISDLRKLLRSTTRNFPPFKFSLEEPAIFKKGKVPRVLWLAIKSPDILLFESRLFPEGAQYLPIEVFPLSQSS